MTEQREKESSARGGELWIDRDTDRDFILLEKLPQKPEIPPKEPKIFNKKIPLQSSFLPVVLKSWSPVRPSWQFIFFWIFSLVSLNQAGHH